MQKRIARPTPRLADRSDRPYGVVQKPGRGSGLLLAPLPHGSQQRFFFLLRPAAPLLLDRAESTDLFVEGHQVLAQLLEAVKLGDLLLGFTHGSGIGKGLRHGLAGHAASEAELRVMSRVVASGAVAGRLAAAAHDRGKGTGSQITQAEELLQELGSFGLQSIDIFRHKGFPSVPQSVCTYIDVQKHATKNEIPQDGTSMSPTRSPSGCIVKLCDGISFPFRPIWRHLWRGKAKELKKKRDEAKQAWENATVVKSKNADDFTGSKKAHGEAERLRVKYLRAERVSEADSDDENMFAMSAHG